MSENRRQILGPTRQPQQMDGTSAHDDPTLEGDRGRIGGQAEALRQRGRSPVGGGWQGRGRPGGNPGGYGHTTILAVTVTAQLRSLRPPWEEAIVLAEDQDVHETEAAADDDVDEVMVEEISIDGMCGVY